MCIQFFGTLCIGLVLSEVSGIHWASWNISPADKEVPTVLVKLLYLVILCSRRKNFLSHSCVCYSFMLTVTKWKWLFFPLIHIVIYDHYFNSKFYILDSKFLLPTSICPASYHWEISISPQVVLMAPRVIAHLTLSFSKCRTVTFFVSLLIGGNYTLLFLTFILLSEVSRFIFCVYIPHSEVAKYF